ncbi:MAG TPA: Uma2 family endonuclease [Blastocatellia bacterium]
MVLPRTNYSVQEYLDLERRSTERHEYLRGQIYPMAPSRGDATTNPKASLQHSRICVNLMREVSTQLKGRECEALSPNMKVSTGDGGLFSYPDLTVVCGRPVFFDDHNDIVLNPTVIFEVLSPSSESYDRGQKFFRYQTYLSSLAEYLLVSQQLPLVEHFVRQSDGQWVCSFVEGMSSHVEIRAIGCRLALSEIYDRVAFRQPGGSPQ